MSHPHPSPARTAAAGVPRPKPRGSVLGWPAWRRVLAVLPALLALWLAVLWAGLEIAPW